MMGRKTQFLGADIASVCRSAEEMKPLEPHVGVGDVRVAVDAIDECGPFATPPEHCH
jgi:hypothetical protein